MFSRRSEMRAIKGSCRDHFAAITAGPGGIDRLRELVLDLAIRGLLEKQDGVNSRDAEFQHGSRKADPPAGDTRKKAEPPRSIPIFEDNFVLPIGWTWSSLDNLGKVNPRNQDIDDEQLVSFLPMETISPGFSNVAAPTEALWRDIKKGKTHVADGDVILAKITPCFQNRKSIVLSDLTNGVGAGTTEIYVFRPNTALIDPDYAVLFLKTRTFIEGGIRNFTGTAGQKRVPKGYFSNASLPLPPLPEQRRIVEKVNRFMALCDDLDSRQQAEREERRWLRTASLAALEKAATAGEAERAWAHVAGEFGRLVDTLEDVAELRKIIISFTLRGDLTSLERKEHSDSESQSSFDGILHLRKQQWRDWEQERAISSPLLRKKNGAYKNPYEVKSPPHTLPKGWRWVTISQISFQDVGLAYQSEDFVENGIKLLRGENVKPGKIDWKNSKHYPPSLSKGSEQLFLNEGDIVLGMDRPIISSGLRIARISDQDLPCLLVQRVMRFRMVKKEMTDYLYLCLSDDRFSRSLSKSGMTGAQLPHITGDSVHRYPIPLPSLAEQHEIVEKVGRLMSLCDGLEAGIRARDAALEAFAAAACRTVLDGPAPAAAPAAVAVRGTGQQRLAM